MRGNAARASLATAQGDTSFSSRFAAREEQNKSTLAGRRAEKPRPGEARVVFEYSRSFFADGPRLARITRRFRGLERAFVPFPRRDEKSFENPEKSQSIFFLVSFLDSRTEGCSASNRHARVTQERRVIFP